MESVKRTAEYQVPVSDPRFRHGKGTLCPLAILEYYLTLPVDPLPSVMVMEDPESNIHPS